MSQIFITDYFIKRKRHIADDVKMHSKVMILENQSGNLETDAYKAAGRIDTKTDALDGNRKVILKISADKLTSVLKTSITEQKTKSKISRSGKKGLSEKRVSFNCDIRESFSNASKKYGPQNSCGKKEIRSGNECSMIGSSPPCQQGGVSKSSEPTYNILDENQTSENKNWGKLKSNAHNAEKIEELDLPNGCQEEVETEKSLDTRSARKELGLMTPKRLTGNSDFSKGLSLNEIRNKLSRSSRLAELKQTVTKINKCTAKLKELETKRKTLETPDTPKLQKFKTLDVEVPISPQSSVCSTPQKLTSPLKSPLKSPAHQRYAALARSELPVLPLPYSYRCLAEAFRCLDTVVSMMHNRKESITFTKVSPSVREMLRREFTESHLSQIKYVYPEAYSYSQQKRPIFGCAVKQEKYELTIEPALSEMKKGEEAGMSQTVSPMTPSCLLERRKVFHSKLLDMVKDHHEEFLKSMEPPMLLEKSKVTRWHPEFDVDQLPAIPVDSLPKPPNETTYSTAKDVLERAKDMFQCNKRMETALKLLSDKQSEKKSEHSSKTEINKRIETFKTDLYKGIPKSVLEKVRAKQAAKALKEMTLKPEEEKELVRYTRLPEIARILRTLFVAERKRVLPMELVLDKLCDSTRENLPINELKMHIELLVKTVPGWLDSEVIRTARYLRLSKNGDMAKVMKRLETLAESKNVL